VIFRDCMNGLEYVIQVFEYFKEKLTSWSTPLLGQEHHFSGEDQLNVHISFRRKHRIASSQ
jgi:hypothetical protein